MLGFPLRAEYDLPTLRNIGRTFPELCDHMYGRGILHGLRGVEPEAVEVKFVDPVSGVLDEMGAYTAFGFEVDRRPPIASVFFGEEVVRELSVIISARSHVVVHDVQNDPEAE